MNAAILVFDKVLPAAEWASSVLSLWQFLSVLESGTNIVLGARLAETPVYQLAEARTLLFALQVKLASHIASALDSPVVSVELRAALGAQIEQLSVLENRFKAATQALVQVRV